jgi:hypothetical protein
MNLRIWLGLAVALTLTLPTVARAERRDQERHGERVAAPLRVPIPLRFVPLPPAPDPRQIQPPNERPGGRYLSPEERRQLRRDINDAGREIYRRDRPER